MATLYELSTDYLALYNRLTIRDLDEETIQDTLESTGLADDIHNKAENYALVLNQLENDVKMLDSEIRRLSDRKQMFQSNAVKLKNNLFEQLKKVNETKFKTNLFSFTTRKSQSVKVTKIDELPDMYVRVETKKSADKTEIKKAIKSGHPVNGAELVNNESLVIK